MRPLQLVFARADVSVQLPAMLTRLPAKQAVLPLVVSKVLVLCFFRQAVNLAKLAACNAVLSAMARSEVVGVAVGRIEEAAAAGPVELDENWHDLLARIERPGCVHAALMGVER